jgi:hypothetical protein
MLDGRDGAAPALGPADLVALHRTCYVATRLRTPAWSVFYRLEAQVLSFWRKSMVTSTAKRALALEHIEPANAAPQCGAKTRAGRFTREAPAHRRAARRRGVKT